MSNITRADKRPSGFRILPAVLKVTGSLFVFLLLNAFAAAQPADTISVVAVVFHPSGKAFPARWYNPKIRASAIPLSKEDLQRADRILRQALAKYPESLLHRYLERIYVFSSMKFYGISYGGTHARKTVYITMKENNPVYTDPFTEALFHHEFSSILLKKNGGSLSKKAWESCNPAGFHYGTGGRTAILNGNAATRFDPSLFSSGFLNQYAMSSFEEDVNVTAQNLFCGGPEFWQIVESNPKIRNKVMLLIKFYQSLDPAFTENRFRTSRNFN